MGSYWGIYIEDKITQYIEHIIWVKGFNFDRYKKWSSKLMKKYKGVLKTLMKKWKPTISNESRVLLNWEGVLCLY